MRWEDRLCDLAFGLILVVLCLLCLLCVPVWLLLLIWHHATLRGQRPAEIDILGPSE